MRGLMGRGGGREEEEGEDSSFDFIISLFLSHYYFLFLKKVLPFGFLSFWLEIQSYSSSIHRDGRMVNCILVSDLFIVGMQQRNGWRIITDHNESILILCNWIEGLDRNLLLRVSTLKIASSNRLVS